MNKKSKFGTLAQHQRNQQDIIVLIYSILIAGIASIAKGMDRSFDVRNYHIYNPFALLNNRYHTDIMPADIQTYLNPFLDIPYYLMVKYFNNFAYIVTFLQGLSYAFLIFIVYKLSQAIFEEKKLYVWLSVLIGSTGALTLYNIGTNTHDLFVGDVVLVGVYLLIKSIKKYSLKNIVISGLLLGGICGLKLTAGIFVLAIFLSVLCFKSYFKNIFKTAISFGLSLLGGFLITNGFWAYKLFSLFHNPFFPYFNGIFHSDFANVENLLKEDFINLYPQNVWQYIFFPYYFYQHVPTRGFELNYQDFRFAGIYTVFFLNLLSFKWFDKKYFEQNYGINYDIINFLICICAFSYVFWVNTFATVRYLTPISAISGIIILAGVTRVFTVLEQKYNLNNQKINFGKYIATCQDLKRFIEKAPQRFILSFNYKKHILPLLLCLVSVYLLVKTIEPQMLKRIPIREQLVSVDNMHIPDNATVIAVSGSGIIIPFQNPNCKYIYLNAPRFTERKVNILSDSVQNDIKKLIHSSGDNVYFMMDLAIYNKTLRLTKEALDMYTDIDFDKSQCKLITTNISNKKTASYYVLCKAEIK